VGTSARQHQRRLWVNKFRWVLLLLLLLYLANNLQGCRVLSGSGKHSQTSGVPADSGKNCSCTRCHPLGPSNKSNQDDGSCCALQPERSATFAEKHGVGSRLVADGCQACHDGALAPDCRHAR